MKKLMMVGGVVVLAAGFAGAAYWSGAQAERWYRQMLAENAKQSGMSMTAASYQRGLFSSKAVTRYQITLEESPTAEGPDWSFATREEIYHGPLPIAGWGVADVPMSVGGAVIRQTLDPDSSAWTRRLANWYGGREPLVAVTRVGFDGASTSQITMPPLELAKVEQVQSLRFSGLQGQLKMAPRGAVAVGDVKVERLEVVGQPNADSTGSPSDGPRIQLQDLTAAVNQRKGAFDLMLGDSRFKIGEVQLQDSSSGPVTRIVNLGMEATGALNAQNPQQVDVDVLWKADQVTAASWSGTGSVRLALHRLDGATLSQFQQWYQNTSNHPTEVQILDDMQKLAKTLLRGKPELALDTEAKLAQGEWRSKLLLNFQDYGDANPLQNPISLLSALDRGLLDITVTKSLADMVLAEQIQGMLAAGFVQLQGDHYQTQARFENGRLWVNDREIPLGLAGGAGQGATGESGLPEPDAAQEKESAPQ